MASKNGQSKLGDFKPSTQNANRHTQRGMGMLAASIRQDGYLTPLTVAADGEAIDGSARLETVADVMGLDVDPIIIRSDGTRPVIHVREDIPDASDPRAVRLALAANRIGQVNLDFDADVLAAIADAGEVDLSALWRDEELAEVLGMVPDFEPVGIEDQGRLDQKAPVTCPACGHEFSPA